MGAPVGKSISVIWDAIQKSFGLLFSIGWVSNDPFEIKLLFHRGIFIRYAWVLIAPLVAYQIAFHNDSKSFFRKVFNLAPAYNPETAGGKLLPEPLLGLPYHTILNTTFIVGCSLLIVVSFLILLLRDRPLVITRGEPFYDNHKQKSYADLAFLFAMFLFMLSAFLIFMYANYLDLECLSKTPSKTYKTIRVEYVRYPQLFTLGIFFGLSGIFLVIFGQKIRDRVQIELIRKLEKGFDADIQSGKLFPGNVVIDRLASRIARRRMEIDGLRLFNVWAMSLVFLFFAFGIYLSAEAAVAIVLLGKDTELSASVIAGGDSPFSVLLCDAGHRLPPLIAALQLSPFKALAVAAGVTSYSLVPMIWWAGRLRVIREYEMQLREMIIERDLRAYELLEEKKTFAESAKAEKLFRANQNQLQKYYDQNRMQNVTIFLVGVGCLVMSVAIVALSLHFIANVKGEKAEEMKNAITLLGAVGTVMTNVTAAIYLAMHKSIADAMTKFHQRLVKSHELFFANVITSQIDTDEETDKNKVFKALAENLRADIAREIVKNAGKD